MRTIRFRAKPCYKGGKQSPWVYGTFQYIAQQKIQTQKDRDQHEPPAVKSIVQVQCYDQSRASL